jgi:hypothetical protein
VKRTFHLRLAIYTATDILSFSILFFRGIGHRPGSILLKPDHKGSYMSSQAIAKNTHLAAAKVSESPQIITARNQHHYKFLAEDKLHNRANRQLSISSPDLAHHIKALAIPHQA